MARAMKLVPIEPMEIESKVTDADVHGFLAKHRVELDPNGRVIYPDGSLGSHVRTLISYHLAAAPKPAKPFDYTDFNRLIVADNSINNSGKPGAWIKFTG